MMEDVGEGFEFVVEYELPEKYKVRTRDKRGKERLYDRIKYMLKVGTGEYGPAPVREHLYLVDSSSADDPLPVVSRLDREKGITLRLKSGSTEPS